MLGERVELAMLEPICEGIGLAPAEHGGMEILSNYALDRALRHLVAVGDGWIATHFPGENQIIGGERSAIVPGDVRAQLVGDLHLAVRADPPGALRDRRKLG